MRVAMGPPRAPDRRASKAAAAAAAPPQGLTLPMVLLGVAAEGAAARRPPARALARWRGDLPCKSCRGPGSLAESPFKINAGEEELCNDFFKDPCCDRQAEMGIGSFLNARSDPERVVCFEIDFWTELGSSSRGDVNPPLSPLKPPS